MGGNMKDGPKPGVADWYKVRAAGTRCCRWFCDIMQWHCGESHNPKVVDWRRLRQCLPRCFAGIRDSSMLHLLACNACTAWPSQSIIAGAQMPVENCVSIHCSVWFCVQGPTLFNVLDEIEPQARDPYVPFRMPIMDRYRWAGRVGLSD